MAKVERTADGRIEGPDAAKVLRSPVVECFCITCGQLTRMFQVLVDEPECLCLDCADKKIYQRHTEAPADTAWFERRTKATGLHDQKRIVETLRLTPQKFCEAQS